MFKQIVDQYGKPFSPDPLSSLTRLSLARAVDILAEAAKPSALEQMIKIAALRESCGADPGTITFRRYLPFQVKETGDEP